jgi:hypothetical protein
MPGLRMPVAPRGRGMPRPYETHETYSARVVGVAAATADAFRDLRDRNSR